MLLRNWLEFRLGICAKTAAQSLGVGDGCELADEKAEEMLESYRYQMRPPGQSSITVTTWL